MANLQFEGDLIGLNEVQLKFVGSVLEDRGFVDGKVIVSGVGKADDNYGSIVKRFAIEKNGETFSMIAKVTPPIPEAIRSQMNVNSVFRNEYIMYSQVLPKFTELEKGADVPENERFKYATCYGAITEEPNDIILLEDLDTSNLVLLNKYESFTNETARLVIKNFAILHSLSYVLKNQEPETFEAFKNKLINKLTFMFSNEGFLPFLQQIENRFLALLDNGQHKKIVKGVASKIPSFAAKNIKIDKDSKYSVIQQGDGWTNNMMFKMEGDKPVQCCLIDYQLSGNSTPVADLHYMIFACTDYETRSKHYYEWIDYYHQELDRSLSNYGLKANIIYPRDQLDVDLKRYARLSFGIAMMLANMLLIDTGEAASMKENMGNMDANAGIEDVFNLNGVKANDKMLQVRALGLVQSFIELGYV